MTRKPVIRPLTMSAWRNAIVLAYVKRHGPARPGQIGAALGIDQTSLWGALRALRGGGAAMIDEEGFWTATQTPRERLAAVIRTELNRQAVPADADAIADAVARSI